MFNLILHLPAKQDILNQANSAIMDIEVFRKLALSFPETIEAPHFEKTSFRINKGKIFATLDAKAGNACLKLSEVDQSIFCGIDAATIYPVNNKWGKQGWTIIALKTVKKNILKDALSKAYLVAVPKKVAQKKIVINKQL